VIRQQGFTLLELLISLSIFALIGAMAYGGLQQVLQQQQATEENAQQLADLQKAYRIMQRDLEQLVNRGIRNEYGDAVAALVGGSGYNGIEFSRAGYANPAGFLRSNLQRIAYVPDQDTLIRRTWRVLDRAQDSSPDEEVLIEGLQQFTIRFLDDADEWQDNWPPQQTQSGDTRVIELPRAAQVEILLDDIGTLSWIFVFPDNFIAGTQAPVGDANTGTDDSNEEVEPEEES
jgi:general secretion pathway protein J